MRAEIAALGVLAVLAVPGAGCRGGAARDSDTTGFDATSGADAATWSDGGDGGAGPAVWEPAPGTSWQWQLTGPIDTTVDVAMYDVDLFDAPQATLDGLRAAGRAVVCYFSAGSREDWRPDASAFLSSEHGNALAGWPGETWLDVRSDNVRQIMQARLDLAVAKGCDGVEPDNVDGYANDSGFPLSMADQLDYDSFLAREAHLRGLSVGLKNTVELVPALEPEFDWALNEECLTYDECLTLSPFIAAGKAVFHVEYVNDPAGGPGLAATVCGDPTIAGFSTLVKTWDLDAWRLACP